MDYSETDVCERLGVTLPLLRTLAKQIVREGNITKKSRAVRYSEAGVKALAEIIAETAAQTKEAPGAILALPAAKKLHVVCLVVWRSRDQGIRNDKIVIAHPLETDPLDAKNHITVRVRDNANYMRGMRFEVRMTDDQLGDAWDSRTNLPALAPRSRGRL